MSNYPTDENTCQQIPSAVPGYKQLDLRQWTKLYVEQMIKEVVHFGQALIEEPFHVPLPSSRTKQAAHASDLQRNYAS